MNVFPYKVKIHKFAVKKNQSSQLKMQDSNILCNISSLRLQAPSNLFPLPGTSPSFCATVICSQSELEYALVKLALRSVPLGHFNITSSLWKGANPSLNWMIWFVKLYFFFFSQPTSYTNFQSKNQHFNTKSMCVNYVFIFIPWVGKYITFFKFQLS